jgi:hypothetical protein
VSTIYSDFESLCISDEPLSWRNSSVSTQSTRRL